MRRRLDTLLLPYFIRYTKDTPLKRAESEQLVSLEEAKHDPRYGHLVRHVLKTPETSELAEIDIVDGATYHNLLWVGQDAGFWTRICLRSGSDARAWRAVICTKELLIWSRTICYTHLMMVILTVLYHLSN